MPEEDDGEKFLIGFPIYCIAQSMFVHSVTGGAQIHGPAMFRGHDEGSPGGVILFTDWNAAAEYRDEQMPDCRVFPLYKELMLLFLLVAQQRGTEWVTFDPYRPDREVTQYRIELVISWLSAKRNG